jgi:S1-C subfamily serine protease
MKKLIACATLILGNIAWFYAMKNYTDNRQVRIVSATCQSTVEVSAIGPIFKTITVMLPIGKHEILIKQIKKRIGFGELNRGNGVFVSNDGLILTCYHVTKHSKLLRVSLNGFEREDSTPRMVRRHRKLFAYVVGVDEKNDLALLRVFYPGQWFRGVSLRKDAPKGLPVFTIGFPVEFQKHVTTGVVSSFSDGMTYTDVVIEHGSSGGGLFDIDGKLVGLASFMRYPAGFPVYSGFSGFTDLDAMHRILEKYEAF